MGGLGGDEKMTRGVGKFLVSDEVLQEIIHSPWINSYLEVAVPTPLVLESGQRTWLTVFGVNNPSRKAITPPEVMMRQVDTDSHFRHNHTPLERIAELRRDGYAFIDSMIGHEQELEALWSTTFGWDLHGVEGRREVIESQRNCRTSDRNSWFAGIVDSTGRLVVAAVAERLDIPVGDVAVLPIIELSEWRRADFVERPGLMAAYNTYLIAQVLRDLSTLHPAPLLFAETNYMSSAHRVGFASGMDIARVSMGDSRVQQILVQNVSVGDGYMPEGLRDFTMMYVPQENIQTFYSLADLQVILGRPV